MAKVSILIAFLTHFLCALGQKQLSECSEYFTYMSKPGTADMLGQIEIPPPSPNDMFYLKVALSTTTELSQVVRLELARSIKESVGRVHQGRPLLYHIYCPINEQIPSISAIWFNNQQYCPGPEVSGNVTANVELRHVLSPPSTEPIVYSFGPWQEISQPWHRNLSIYRMDYPPYDRLNLNDSTTMTISSSDENANECEGQCVREFSSRLIEPQNLWVIFGQLKSREWNGKHTGIINRVVANYTLFPFDPSIQDITYSQGLAILLLRTAVEYNAFIRPVCLWSGSTNRQDMVNMTGYVVGWGSDYIRRDNDFRTYTGEPRMSKVPLANISVDSWEYGLFTRPGCSDIFCCPDIRGGLMVFNTTMGRYQLRGVTFICSTWEIVFFDITKVTSWIEQQIQFT